MSIHHSPVDTTQDGLFAHALIEAGVRTRALAEEGRPVPQPRARRFAARVSLRYRIRGAAAWSPGITDNVSRTGVFFRTDAPCLPQPGAELELVLNTPTPSRPGRPDVVTAWGAVVRVTYDPTLPEMLPGVAVAVEWRSASGQTGRHGGLPLPEVRADGTSATRTVTEGVECSGDNQTARPEPAR